MELNKNQFFIIKDFIYTICSIDLADDKMYLVKQRLEPLIKKYNLKGYDDLINHMATPDQNFISEIISAITTNETYFFRDPHIFEGIKKHIIPKLAEKSKFGEVKIWSAASSTGQEAYTLAMLLDDYITLNPNKGYFRQKIKIMATDIDLETIKKAVSGVYTNLEIGRGLPEYYKNKYFKQLNSGWTQSWKLSDEIMRMVKFLPLNLTGNLPFPQFNDFVLCRNVLIYFDLVTKKEVIDKIFKVLNPEGYFLLGSSETLYGIYDKLKNENLDKMIIYKKPK